VEGQAGGRLGGRLNDRPDRGRDRDPARPSEAVADLLERPDQIVRLGEAAKRRVLDNFVGDLHLLRYAALIEKLVARPGAAL
jgi:hypothetical protein